MLSPLYFPFFTVHRPDCLRHVGKSCAALVYICCAFLLMQTSAHAQWTNGQAATYVLGQANFTANTAAAGANGMSFAEGMAIDATNNKLYVVDRNNHRVLRFAYPITSNRPNCEVVFGQTNTSNSAVNAGAGVGAVGFNNPTSVAVNTATGDIFVTDFSNHRILRFATAHLVANGAHGPAAASVIGQPNFTTSAFGTSQNTLNGPHAVVITPGFNNMWIADLTNNRVVRVPNASITATQPNFDFCIGQTSWTNNFTGTGANQLSSPAGICVDAAATWLFVADAANNRVLRFATPPAMPFNAFAAAVLGQTGFGVSAMGNGGAQMNNVRDVAMDASGTLYVSDPGNHRVLTFNNATSLANGATADNVLGQSGFGVGGAGLSATQFNTPRGLAVNGITLLVSEQNNNRVMGFSTSTAPWLYMGSLAATSVMRTRTDGMDKVTNLLTTSVNARGAQGELSSGFTVWSNPSPSNTIGRANLDGTGVNNSFITGVSNPYSPILAGGYVYWINRGTNSIGRALWNGTGVNTSFITGCWTPENMVVDAVNGFIYWTNYGTNAIGRANIDGTGVNQSLVTTLVGPTALDVDPVNNKIYWGHWGSPVIQWANTDGTGVATWYTAPGSILGLAVDQPNGKVYWHEYSAARIGVANLNASSPNNSHITGLPNGVGMNLVKSTPAPPSPTVTSFLPTNAGPGQTVTITGTGFSGISQVQFGGTNAASFTVVSATQITAVVNVGASGSVSVTNVSGTGSQAGFTYNAPTVTTLYAARTGGQIGTVRTDASMQNLAAATGIGFGRDVFRQGAYIYWCDETGNRIGRANADGSSPNVNFITGCSSPNGVYVTATNIYWTNYGSTTLGRANLDGTGVNQSFCNTGVSQPVSIAVDVAGGFIYWSRTNFNTIGRVALDGITGLNASFMTGLTSPGGIWIDNPNNFIYFTQAGASNSIQRAQLSTGTGVTTLVTGCSTPNGITSDGTFLYWSNQGTGNIGRSLMSGAGANQAFSTGFTTTIRGIGIGPNPAPGPTISGFTPATAQGGATITINGTNLTGPTSVMLGNQSVAFTPVSASQITFTVPVLGGGGLISVTTPNGSAQSATGLGFNGTFVVGQPNFVSGGAATTSTGLNFPEGMAVDVARGKLYVADRANNRVLRFAWPVVSNTPVAQMVFGQPNFTSNTTGLSASSLNTPIDVVVDQATGDLWVSEYGNHRVLRFAAAHSFNTNQPAATQVLGQPNFTTNVTATTQSGLYGVHGLSLDASGRLWVADMQNNRVLRFDNPASLGNGANASGVLGQTLFNSGGTALTQSGMSSPHDVALDAAGNLFVSDLVSNRILRFNNAAAKANGANADGVLGQTLFTTSAAAATATGLNGALGLAVSPAGDLFVCDRLNRRVVVFNNAAAKANGAAADRVLGQTLFTTNGAATTQSGMNEPRFATFVSGDNVLLTSDLLNNRVVLYGTPTPQSTPTVTSFLPTSALAGATVVITGTNFNNASVVQFGGTNAASFVVNSPTQITAVVGAGASGNVSVTTPGGSANQGGFTFLAPPTISGFAPTSAQAGAVITINGANFTGTTQVLIGGTPAAFTIVSAVQITATVPNVCGSGVISVTTPIGTGTSAGGFTYLATYVLGQTNFTTSTPGLLNNKFNAPNALTIDAANNKLYVAEWGNNRVMRFSLPITQNSQLPEAVFGQVNFTSSAANGGGGTNAAGVSGPFTMSVGTGGDLWITDIINNRLVMIPSAHTAANGASATMVIGQPNLTSNAAGLSAQNIATPYAGRLDAAGNMWVADNVNRRVLRFNAPLSTFPSAAVALGVPDFTTNNAVAPSSVRTGNTGDVAVVGASIYVVDGPNNRILRYDSPYLTGMAASVVLGQPTMTTGAANNPNTTLGLNGIQDLFTNGTDLFATDYLNNRVLVYLNVNSKTSGAAPDAVIGQPDFTTLSAGLTQSKLNAMHNVTVSAAGQLIIADQGNNRVLVFGPTFVTPAPTVASFLPTSALAGATITIRGTNFTGTTQVQFGGVNAASFTVISATEISAVVAAGGASGNVSVTTPAGTGNQPGFIFLAPPTISGFTPTAAQGGAVITINGANFTGTTDVKIGNQSVAYTIVSATQITATVPALGGGGLISVTTPIGTGSSATGFGFNGSFVIGQTGFTAGGVGTTPTTVNFVEGAAVDVTNGKLYLADRSNSRVLRYAWPIVANTPAAQIAFGQPNLTSGAANNGGLSASSLSSPTGLAVDAATGDLWVSDASNHRILRFAAAHTITTNQPAAVQVLGQPNFTSNGATTTQTGLNFPTGLTLEAGGRLWAADYFNNRVVRFDNAAALGNGANANSVLGQPNFTSSAGALTQSSIAAPNGISVDAAGNLYVADYLAHRVLRFNNAAAKANGANADGVLGQTLFTTNVGGVATMNQPVGVVVSPAGDLFVSENANHRILGFNNALAKANGAAPDRVFGQLGFTTNAAATSQPGMNQGRHLAWVPGDNVLVSTENGNNRVVLYGTPTPQPTPTISGFSPTSALAGATIVITGTNFNNASVVQFGGTNAASFVVNSPTQITAVLGAGATGNVTVTTPGGTVNQPGFSLQTPPTAFSAATPPTGTVGSAYTYTFVANGSPAPTYAVQSGTLPPGLTLSGAGVLSGTPTGAGGTFGPIVIRATNVGGFFDCTPFNITINAAPTAFTAQTPPIGAPSVAYGPYSFVANGFPTPTYAVQTGGALPAGLTLSGAGVLSGTPSVGGVFGPYTIRATNIAGTFDTAPFSITLGLAPTAFSAQTPPTGALGLPYSYIFTANGIPAPTYAVQSGTLPAGITLNASTGEISGTPSATGTFGPITIRATNLMGTFDTAPFSIVINTAPTAFTAQTPPVGTSGSAYSYTFAANGSPAPTYSLFAGTLPPGLTLNASTGALSGTPTSGGTYSGIVIRASNIAGAFNSNPVSITVNGAPTSFVAAPANGVVGTPYSSFFSANGFPAPVYALFSGVLPTGLSLNASTGELSGTPTVAGVFGVTVIRASNIAGSFNSNSFNITIAAAPSSPTAFSAQTPVNGTAGAAYSYTVVANGFPSPTYSVSAGTLPAGLTLNAATGAITGTPTVSGTFGPITIQASNGSGTLNSTPFSMTINGAPTSFSAQTPGNGVVGTPYNYAFAVNGLPASTFTVIAGTLPTGLTLSGAGVISGTPSVAATFGPITVQASNGLGSVNTSAFNITIAATGSAPTAFTLQSPPNGLVGGSYGYTFAANGSPAPNFAVNSGTLPAGLTLTAANGLLSGVPTTAGVFGPITLAATNGFGSTTSAPFNITVNEAPSSFTAQTPPSGAVGTAYSYALVANGFPAPAYSLVSGTLPAGLTLSGTGVISGTPSASGVFSGIVVKAQNAFGNVNTVSMSISISAVAVIPTVFTAQTPPNGNQTVPYTYTFAANGSPSPTYSVFAGTLPTGLTLNAATGVLSGTPTVAGPFGPITIQATNGAGSFNTTPFTIAIQQAPPTITNFTPTGSIAGATITINGTNLTGVSAVSFGGVPAASFTPVSATQVTAVVAAGGATGNVSLTTPGGTVSLGVYSFFAPPTLTSFTPSAAAQGATVTITGTNFTGAGAVQFGGTNAASFTVVSPTQITAVVPIGAPNATLSVTTPGGIATSGAAFMLTASSNEFYYQAGPADNPANWNTLLNGGGLTASSFAMSGQSFYVPMGRTATFTAGGTFGAGVVLQAENGGIITVPSAQTLTANGILRVNNGGRLRLEGTGNIITTGGAQYLGVDAVLEFANASNRLVSSDIFPQSFPSSLKLDNAQIRLNETKNITGAFTAENGSEVRLGATLAGVGNSLSLLGAITMTGASRFNTDSSNSLTIAGGGAFTGAMTFTASSGTPVIARLALQRSNALIRLASNLRVSTTLTLQAGVIEPQMGVTLTLGSAQDTALQGGSAQSFVRGAFARVLPINVNGNNPLTPQFRFPIGKGSQYLPASIIAATTGTASPLISLEAFNAGSVGSVAAGSGGSVSPSEHWQMNVLAGNLLQYRIATSRDSIPTNAKIGVSSSRTGAYSEKGGTKESTSQGAQLLSSALPTASPVPFEQFISYLELLPTSPRIADFTPLTGTTGTLLTIIGDNFTGATAVRVGGMAVQSFTVVNSTTVTAVLGSNVVTGVVSVVAPSGTATSTATLTFIPPLGGGMAGGSGGGGTGSGSGTGSGITPPAGSGITGGGVGLGGGIIAGGGSNGNPGFGPIPLGPGNPLVLVGLTPQQLIGLTIGGVPAQFIFLPNGSVQVIIPPNVTSATLVITTPNGTITSTDAFVIADTPANLTISPSIGSTGGVITLTGSGFEGVQSVSIGGVPATSFTVNSDTRVSAIVPPLPAGASPQVRVEMVSAGGVVAGDFAYSSAPPFRPSTSGTLSRPLVLTKVVEKTAVGGQEIVLQGQNLDVIRAVRLRTTLGATMASYTVRSAEEMLITVPFSGLLATTSGTSVMAQVTVEAISRTTPAEQVALQNAFTLLLLPSVSSVSHTIAFVGETVVLTGTNFQAVAELFVGETRVMFRREGNERIIFTMPSVDGSANGVPAAGVLALVGAPLPSSSSSSSSSETQANTSAAPSFRITSDVLNAPLLAGLPLPLGFTPLSGTSLTEITVTGANMSVVASIQINGVSLLNFRRVSPSEVRGQVPATASRNRFGTVQLFNATGASVTLTGRFAFTESLEQDSLALASLAALAPAKRIMDWANPLPVAVWKGVEVLNNRVIRVSAPSLGLQGAIPSALAQLTKLRELNLSGNAFTGGIPTGFQAFSDLQTLNLSGNQFTETTSLTTVCALPRLRVLNLSGNRFTGEIPRCLAGMGVQVLNLSNNRFTGSIPREFASAANLEEFRLAGNLLTGELPREFGLFFQALAKTTTQTNQTETLRIFDASNNQLSGRIPQEWGNISTLEELNLAGNRLQGGLPQNLTAWRNIQVLRVAGNALTGELPGSLPLAQLRELSLANNNFTGIIPPSLSDAQRLRLVDIANNRFTVLPNISGIARLDSVRVGNNRLQFGSLLPNMGIKSFSYTPQDSLGRQIDTLVFLNRSLVLAAVSSGFGNRYQWFKNGVVVPNAETDVLVIRTMARQDTGVYTCRVSNPAVPNLTLSTFGMRVSATTPNVVLGAPNLIFPPQAAQNVGVTTRLQWQRIQAADEYFCIVARDSSLREVVLRRTIPQPALTGTSTDTSSVSTTIANLARGVTYYWQVQSLNANVGIGAAGSQSPKYSFTTVPLGRELAFTTLDVGKAIIGERSEARGVIINVGENPITLDRIQIAAGDQVFDLDSVRGRVLQPREEIPVRIVFVPREEGVVRATISVTYTDFMQALRNIVFEEALRARGTPLKALVVEFDTVRVGKRSLGSMLIVNRGSRNVRVREALVIPPFGEERDSTYTVQGLANLVLAPQDTAYALIRCFPRSVGLKSARIEIRAEEDTTFAEVGAFARLPQPNDAVAVFGLRATPDSIAPGGAVTLELYLDKDQSSDLNKILRSAQPIFQGSVRFGSQVLALDPSEKAVRTLRRGSVESARGPATAIIPQTSWDGRSYSLLRFKARAIAGESDKDSLQIEDIKWGVQGRKPEIWEAKVFVEDPVVNYFTAQACAAGGKRLVTTAQATKIMALTPNPMKNGQGEIAYAVREDGEVVIEIISAATGAVVKRIADGDHKAGEYALGFSTQDLPSGAYIVRLQAANALVFKRVDVVR